MKKILPLVLSSTLLYSCSQSLEDKKQDLEEKLLEIQETISENPNDYQEVIDNILTQTYQLKLQTLNQQVRTGYISPSDFSYQFNQTQEGVYVSIYNQRTQETLDLVYAGETTQLGDFNHRINGLKEESGKIFYENTKGIGRGLDAISERWKEAWFFIENLF